MEQVVQESEESCGTKMEGEDITEEEMEIGYIATPKMLKVKKNEKPQVISGKQTLSKPVATARSHTQRDIIENTRRNNH